MPTSITDATRQAQALKSDGRLEEAIESHRAIVAAYPGSAVAVHNLASALGDAGYWAEAEPEIRAAMAMGLDAPETWLVLARSLQALGRLDEAETSYRETLRRRPLLDAYRELTQLRWMRGGDIASALVDLDQAITAAPGAIDLTIVKAQALTEASDGKAALALLLSACTALPNDGNLATIIAQTALAEGQTETALAHASRAVGLSPDLPAAHAVLVEAMLSAGRFQPASAAAEEFRRRAPFNQHAIALQATAWRALGDTRYAKLYDYDALLCVTQLSVPRGWPTLDAYLADLAVALNQAHHFRTHPFAQSVRRGSQAANVMQLPHPATRALRAALDEPLRAYIGAVGHGPDPMRARNTGAYKFQGAWSIRMYAGGSHINHVHPQGWLSSACYVEVPDTSAGKEGWLKLGEPSVRCGLEAERYVEPIPGRLVLFPSYMWHGAVPFTGSGARLTFAFDVIPG